MATATGTAATDLPAVSTQLDTELAGAISNAQGTFNQSMSGAADDLGGLVWAIAISSLLVVLLLFLGFRPRIAEYR